MDFIIKIFDTIQAPGPTVMMPVIIFILSLCLGVKVKKAVIAGLMIGVGFVGLNTVIGMMGGELAPAVQAMVGRYGLTLDAIDIGWVPSAAIAFASNIGSIIIPLGIVVNVVMLLTNTTQTIDVDIWNYWHFAFTGAMIQSLTGSLAMGMVAAALNMIIVMVIADRTAKGVEKYNGLPGVTFPMGFTAAFAPIAAVVNFIMDKIPGVKNVNVNMEKLQSKLGVFGEPVLIGTVFGLILGFLAGYKFVTVLQLAIALGAALVLIPKMAAILMEGLLPVSDATQTFIEKRFKNRGKIFVGLDSAVAIGHPLVMTSAILIMPISIFIAVILPGNRVLPFADLGVFPHVFVLTIAITRGDFIRSFIVGIVSTIIMLYCGTSMVPLLMSTAAVADPATYANYGSAFSSICDGSNPLTWAMIQFANLKWIGIAIMAVISVGLAYWNRVMIKKQTLSEAAAAE